MSTDDLPISPWPFPKRISFHGCSVCLEPLGQEHAPELWHSAQGSDQSWAHLRYGPFASQVAMAGQVTELAGRADQPFWAVRPRASGIAEGWLSLCDVYPADGAIEIGSIWFSLRLQRTRAATEAVFLLMQHALDDLGYQRLVWRCLLANQASLDAAARYGFTHEGVWRRAALLKGRLETVAWHSMLTEEWPKRRAAIKAWLADDNFDELGRARTRLARAFA